MSKDTKRESQQTRVDEVLRRMLATPPEPHKPKVVATKRAAKKALKKKPA